MGLLEAARALLDTNLNFSLGATTPSSDLTSFQASPDSLFAAYAWSHLDVDKAMAELRATLLGQWPNGLIPKMRIGPEFISSTWLPGALYPGPTIWRTWQQSNHLTAGLAATPLQAFVAMQIFYQQRDAASLNFLADVSS